MGFVYQGKPATCSPRLCPHCERLVSRLPTKHNLHKKASKRRFTKRPPLFPKLSSTAETRSYSTSTMQATFPPMTTIARGQSSKVWFVTNALVVVCEQTEIYTLCACDSTCQEDTVIIMKTRLEMYTIQICTKCTSGCACLPHLIRSKEGRCIARSNCQNTLVAVDSSHFTYCTDPSFQLNCTAHQFASISTYPDSTYF
jgi:hypothetical protein